MNFLLAMPNSLKISLLSLLVLIPLGIYTKHLHNELAEQKSANAQLSGEITRLNNYLVQSSKDKALIEKEKSDVLSKLHKNPTNDSVPPSIANVVDSLPDDPTGLATP